jgi:sulfide dehydrogenase cytochrome subunit
LTLIKYERMHRWYENEALADRPRCRLHAQTGEASEQGRVSAAGKRSAYEHIRINQEANRMTSRSRIIVSLLSPIFPLLLAVPAHADAAKIAEACANCHGKNGASTEPEMPIIGGISEGYIVENMTKYKNKERACPEVKYPAGPKKGEATDMCRIAKEVGDDDIKAVAKHFASHKFVAAKQAFDADKAAKGKKVHETNCEKCHSEGGKVSDEDSGILAGQWKPYLEHTFKEFKDGKRAMPKKMKPKMEKLSAGDVEALVNYYASQQ